MGQFARLCRSFLGAAALVVSTGAHPATALSGMDLSGLKIELFDLDPMDGIAPLFDTSQEIEFSDLQGTGQDGPYTEELLPSPFSGLRVTTFPGGYWDNARDTQLSNITLSPMTSVTFSMLAKVGANVSYLSEYAAAGIALRAFDADGQQHPKDQLDAVATQPGPLQETVRTLTVQLVNATRNALSVGYGYAIYAFAMSPVCRKG
jgi:hypothetical protein